MSQQTFKIGGMTYTAKLVDGLYEKFGVLGQAGFNACEIEIDSSLSVERQRQTLIHEIFHAVMYESGYDGDEQDEDMVNRVSLVLYQVFADNNFDFMREEVRVPLAKEDDDF